MAGIEAFREVNECAEGPAAIMAIGTANPPNIVEQSAFPDFYFRITSSEHKQQLKEELRRICQDSSIRKRHLLVSDEMVKENPSLCSFAEPSLDVRQAVVIEEIPKMAKEAAVKAIKEWGRPKSDITHLVFSSASGVDIPGSDYHLSQLLRLQTSVKRLMLYNAGSHAGGTVLRVAKDIAENNKRARVLVVCAELSLLFFRGPHQEHLEDLAVQAVFGDGAAALVVGADPVTGVEKPIFHVASASQVTLPDAGDVIHGHLREVGLEFHRKNQQLAALLCSNIKKPLTKVLAPLGISADWNSLFWVVHPDGQVVLDQLEAELCLEQGKLAASRHVLSEYGNMMCSSVLFVLDEMRKRAVAETRATTGEGLQLGVLVGFGPGLSIETMVLRSVPVQAS